VAAVKIEGVRRLHNRHCEVSIGKPTKLIEDPGLVATGTVPLCGPAKSTDASSSLL
jgi:hypothetical protein